MRHFLTAFVLQVLAVPGLAQDPAGTWIGETTGAGGLAVRPISLVLAADGTGTMEVDVVLELENVTIDSSKVLFSVRPLLGGTTPAGFRFHYEGEVVGDTMTLYVALEGGGGRGNGGAQDPLVLKRKLPSGL